MREKKSKLFLHRVISFVLTELRTFNYEFDCGKIKSSLMCETNDILVLVSTRGRIKLTCSIQ